ncbi:hypothetical protein JXR93_11975 [bacterium]|nr:hypothetical protein [bacterium]
MGASIIAMGAYLPAEKIPEGIKTDFLQFLKKRTKIPSEYIDEMEKTGYFPGNIETNFSGWMSKPWYSEWLKKIPPKKKDDPFQGTKERRRVPFDPISIKESINPHYMLPSDAEVIAGASAIITAGIEADSIDLLIVHSQIPDRALPANASLLQDKLGLKNAGAYSVDTCCSSFITMLEIASSLLISKIKKRVLVISSYIDSHINDKSDYYSVNTGDATVAAVLDFTDDDSGYISSTSTSDGRWHDAIIFKHREPNIFRKAEYSTNYLQYFVTFNNFNSIKSLASLTEENIKYVCFETCKKANININSVDMFVTHQPVSWAANCWRLAVGIDVDKFHQSFEKYGNVATCSSGVNLFEALNFGKIKKDDNILMASSGAGENHIALLFKASKKLIENQKKWS